MEKAEWRDKIWSLCSLTTDLPCDSEQVMPLPGPHSLFCEMKDLVE